MSYDSWLFLVSFVALLVGIYIRFKQTFSTPYDKYAIGKEFAANVLRDSSDKASAVNSLMAMADNPLDYDDFDRGIVDTLRGYEVNHLN